MADLNSTIVRGNLRVTDDENVNGNLKVGGTITGNGSGLTDVAWNNVSGKPSSFAPSSHTHTKSEVGLGNVDNIADANKTVNKANLINPHQNITSTNKSTWDPTNSGKIIWGQQFINNSISIDTGDLTLFLRPSAYSSGSTELCMNIDGDYYSMGVRVARMSDIPTSLPASDVYAWAKAAAKPSYSWSEITGKPSSFAPSSHTHAIADVAGLQDTLNGKASTNHKQAYTASECTSYADDSNCGVTAAAVKKAFSVFEPKAHGHAIGNVTGLQDALSGKANLSHKHAIADVTDLEDTLYYFGCRDDILTYVSANAVDITKIQAEGNGISFGRTEDTTSAKRIVFKTINGNNIVGTGDINISTSVPSATNTTAGIYKVMSRYWVSETNWDNDDTVLTGKSLQWVANQLNWGPPTNTGYLGAYATDDADKHKQIKLADLTGGTKGRFYYIWGTEKCEYGILSVQRLTTFYRDYDCLAMSSNDHGYWSASELFVSIYVPSNTTYYLWGTNIKNVYARWFE